MAGGLSVTSEPNNWNLTPITEQLEQLESDPNEQ